MSASLLDPHRRHAIGGCALVVVLDGFQVAGVLGVAGVGPIGGVLLYGVLGTALVMGRREAAWVLVVMPWVPLFTAVAWLVGLSSMPPHAMMGAVWVAQLFTAFAAAQALDLQR